MLSLEHRSAPAPEPFAIELVADPQGGAYLQVAPRQDDSDHLPQPPLAEDVRKLLAAVGKPISRAAIRRELRVNNQRLGDALLRLERDETAERTSDGWRLRRAQRQLDL